MKFNLILKSFIILFVMTFFLKGSFAVISAKDDKDFKDTYGVQLVLAK